jgi:hypothetical protein
MRESERERERERERVSVCVVRVKERDATSQDLMNVYVFDDEYICI